MRFSAAKNSKSTIPVRNRQDPDKGPKSHPHDGAHDFVQSAFEDSRPHSRQVGHSSLGKHLSRKPFWGGSRTQSSRVSFGPFLHLESRFEGPPPKNHRNRDFGVLPRHPTAEGAGIVFLRFSAAKNSKNTIPARNWRDPDAPAAIMIMTHNNTVANTVITFAVTITPPPTHHRRRAGNRVFEVFGS